MGCCAPAEFLIFRDRLVLWSVKITGDSARAIVVCMYICTCRLDIQNWGSGKSLSLSVYNIICITSRLVCRMRVFAHVYIINYALINIYTFTRRLMVFLRVVWLVRRRLFSPELKVVEFDRKYWRMWSICSFTSLEKIKVKKLIIFWRSKWRIIHTAITTIVQIIIPVNSAAVIAWVAQAYVDLTRLFWHSWHTAIYIQCWRLIVMWEREKCLCAIYIHWPETTGQLKQCRNLL